MAIKFDNGANPSKVMWKSSPSATEQEVFAVQQDGSYVWAKPYTLKAKPSVGTPKDEAVGNDMTKIVTTSKDEYRHCTAIIHSDVNYRYDNATGEICKLTLPDGQIITIALDRTVQWSAYSNSDYPTAITDMGEYTTGLRLRDTWNEVLPDAHPLLISSTTSKVSLVDYRNTGWTFGIFNGPLHGIRLVGEPYYSYEEEIEYEGVGVVLQATGKICVSPINQTYEEGVWQIPIMFYYEKNGSWVSNLANQSFGYGNFCRWTKFERIYLPFTCVNSSSAASSNITFRTNSGTTKWFYTNIASSSTTADGSLSIHNKDAGEQILYEFIKESVISDAGVSFSRYYSKEPTASNTTLNVGDTVYWDDDLRLMKNSSLITKWIINDSMADNNSDIYITDGILNLPAWTRTYQNIYTGYAMYSSSASSLNYITVNEKHYTNTNHKNTRTKTTSYITVGSDFGYSPTDYWGSFATTIEQKKGGYTHTDNFTETRSYGVPSSITTPTITVTDIGSTYVNIKVVNNSSYAGSYYLSFKAYHSVGNPVSYTYNGSIGANSTTIPTINISSYSSQGPIKGIAGTGQIYYLGKGSSSASFSRGDTGGNSGGGDVCLIKNTPILMADNTTKPIQDIVVGDEILGYDFENNCTTPTVVMYSIPTKFQQQAHYVIFDNGKTLCTTRGHELYVVEYGRYVPVEDIKEGEHCLDENGNETEVLAIHWDVELKTFEQFYHIVSSNNTYYANGILNAGVPIDKYRYIHDLRGENIPEPIEALIMDESKDTACFNFTVTNPEFIQKGTPYQSQIKKSRNRIWDLEKLIAKLDEKIAKVAAGLGLDDEYEKLKAKYYKEIAELQEKMVNWEEEYNKLLAQYSELGDDILLDDQERRKKYFRRANKIANDNFEVYKANYVRDPAPKDLGEGVEFIRAEDDYLK